MVGNVGDIMPSLPNITDLPDPNAVPPAGFKQLLDKEGPAAYAKALREHKGLLLMDTTWRDAHQSLLMTRMRTHDIARVAPHTAHVLSKCAALECWGGATFDVCLRFLKECPWKRLRELRKLVPNVPFQMLLRGANAVGYTSYPDNVVYEFVKQAKHAGVDVFRVFDSLNYMENMRLGVDAVRKAGGVIEAAVCYTGDICAPNVQPPYTLEYYMKLVDELVAMGTHIIGIKDMAGLLKPQAATLLISSIRAKYPDIPIHVHTHDTAGTGVASMLACAAAGADIVDGAIDSMSGMTSQPSLGALIASTAGTPLETGINLGQLQDLNDYWQQVRELYSCFDPGLTSGSSDVYMHEMPGGQYTNLLFQSRSLGLGDQWPRIKKAYAEANQVLGNIVKVTPSSKVCGDLAQFMVQNSLLTAEAVRAQAERLSFPQSVVQYFQGQLGEPPLGFPEPLRSRIVKDLPCVSGRPGVSMPPMDLAAVRAQLREKFGVWVNNDDVMSYAMYPKVFEEYATFFNKYGDVSILDTHLFLRPLKEGEEISVELEAGKVLIIKLVALGHLVSIEGNRDVFFELNGMPRRMAIPDNAVRATAITRPKADPNALGDIGAPMSGGVLELRVRQGQTVAAGDPIAVLSAMKMETVVSAPLAGVIQSVAVKVRDSISAGDLIAVITPA
jgi:pyruvate carboxylase